MSDEHSECFYQDISVTDQGYKGNWNAVVFSAYRLILKMDAPKTQYSVQAERIHLR